MKKLNAKTKRFLINRQAKLMRQRIRKNKIKHTHPARANRNQYMKVDTASVHKILESNGFGKGNGEEILKYNGIRSKKKGQVIDKIIIRIPKVLSVSKDSDAALRFLQECYSMIVNNEIGRITFDHTDCAELGLSASTFMDVIVITATAVFESKKSFKYSMNSASVELNGIANSNSDISRILFAGGLPKHIGANMFGSGIGREEVSPLDVISGYSQKGERKSATSATKLTTYFQKCLGREGMELTPEGYDYFTDLFGEVLSNCEIHGGVGGSWYTQGIYLKKEYGGEMQLMFMNIGETIFDGLAKHSSKETKDRLKALLERHRENMDRSWDKEMIYTLFALQDGVSRFRERNKDGFETRGNGTIEMIKAFQAIGANIPNHIPQMTIVSGNTRIVFDDKYNLKTEEFDDDIFGKGKRQIIAFNEENDIYKPADSSNVMKCNMKFPGTVISLKFVLNRDYVEKVKREAV